MNGVAFTKERLLPFYARIGEESIAVLLTFLNADLTPHPIGAHEFELPVKRAPGAEADLFRLTVGDGLTIVGDDLNKLQIVISKARALGRRAEANFHQLYAAAEDHTWLDGPFRWHNRDFDGVNATEEITVGDIAPVTIIISAAGGASINKRGDWDASGNDAPTDAQAWDAWRVSVGSDDWLGSGEPLAVGTFIVARIAGAGQILSDWARL
jgi:hypothetical protein